MTLRNDKISPIMASWLNPISPQPIITAPIMAIPIKTREDLDVRSLYRRKPPTNATTGCKVKIMVELATVVNFREPNQRAKCIAKKNPEKNKKPQSPLTIFLNSLRLIHTKGNIKILANNIRYILMIVAGASDHFTKMAENEIKIMANIIGIPNDLFSIVLTFFLFHSVNDGRSDVENVTILIVHKNKKWTLHSFNVCYLN